MTKHNAENERIKRQYFAYLKEAKRHGEPTVDAAAKALHRFSGELEFLRTVMTGGTPPEGAQAQPGAPAAPQRPPAGAAAQFPQWQPFVAVVDAPDAEESDTEIIDTPDEELAEIEGIEEIRGRGYAAGPEADPMENPPGVVANV